VIQIGNIFVYYQIILISIYELCYKLFCELTNSQTHAGKNKIVRLNLNHCLLQDSVVKILGQINH